MPCTWIGWSYPGCKGGVGYVNAPDSDKTSPAVIKKHGGYGVDADGNGKADPWEVGDAIYAAASHISRPYKKAIQSNPNIPRDEAIKKGIYAYNHSQRYVNDVYNKAMEIKAAAKYEQSDNGSTEVIESGGKSQYGFIAPVTGGRITSTWGDRFVSGSKDFHYALDVAKPIGSKVVAIADGVVKSFKIGCPYGSASSGSPASKCGGGWGNYVWIEHNINGQRYVSVSAHLSSVTGALQSSGKFVKQGTVIGTVGSTGRSTGPHLHIEMHTPSRQKDYRNAINPLYYLPSVE